MPALMHPARGAKEVGSGPELVLSQFSSGCVIDALLVTYWLYWNSNRVSVTGNCGNALPGVAAIAIMVSR
jgi:2-methylaconitate cis-trans-isomerase PrpF